MHLLKQTEKELHPIIQSVGCFFRSSQAIAEIESKKILKPNQINEMWDWAKKAGYIDERNFMIASAPIANHTMKLLDCNKKFYEVGTFANGKTEYYKSIPPSMRKINYCIQKIKTKYREGTHFRVVDFKGNVIFDPDPRVEPTGIFYSILYCVKDI